MKKIYWDIRNNINKAWWTIGGVVAFLTAIQLITGKGIVDFFK
jgi:quinol-cytochrome oxidoreductase complex cytochrome b subunit